MAVVIAGPTASGKSALAKAMARERRAVVINADAMQVYRGLRVLTAAPTEEEELALEHALYGHVDAASHYSVAVWLAEARCAIDAARAEGQTPIVVGGAGLYLASLTQGLSEVPPIPSSVRMHWRERQRVSSAVELHDELTRRDPVMAARLRRSDTQRIVRALEVWDATERSLADWQRERPPAVLPLGPDVTTLVMAPERHWLHERIRQRFVAMLDAGAVEEAVRLTARGLPADRPAMKAIGVAELAAYAAGRLSREEAVTRAVAQSRQYAKRQETWLRNRFPTWHRVRPDA